MIADDIVRAASSRAPEAGPSSAALALLMHVPGLSISTLAAGVGLSHAGTVRLVDRLVSDGLVKRMDSATDGRSRSLYLTKAGEKAGEAVLEARDEVLIEGLSALEPHEVSTLVALSERVLRARLRDEPHAYHICRLCEYKVCANCPIEKELRQRELIE